MQSWLAAYRFCACANLRPIDRPFRRDYIGRQKHKEHMRLYEWDVPDSRIRASDSRVKTFDRDMCFSCTYFNSFDSSNQKE